MMQICFVLFLTPSLFDHRKFHVDPVEADIGVISEAIPALEQVWADINPPEWMMNHIHSPIKKHKYHVSQKKWRIGKKKSPAMGWGPWYTKDLTLSKCSPGAGWCLCPDRQPVWAGPVSEAGARGEMLIWGFPDWFPENKNHQQHGQVDRLQQVMSKSKSATGPRGRMLRDPWSTLFIGNLAI
jgi:hypothetical protein